MRTLNNEAADVLRGLEPSAVTDVTGFGLFGHAHEVAERSGVRIRLESERFPAIDGALDVARQGVRTSGDPRNRDFAGPHVTPERGAGCARRARLRPADRRRAARLDPGRARAGAGGGVRARASSSSAGSAESRRAPESSSNDPWDDPWAVSALSQRSSRVPEGRGGALRGAVRRDHEPRPRADQARGRRTRCGICPSRTRTATSSAC